MLVLFEIQVKGDNCYECMEISRTNLEDYIEVIDLVTFEGMVYNQTEEQILLQFKPIQLCMKQKQEPYYKPLWHLKFPIAVMQIRQITSTSRHFLLIM